MKAALEGVRAEAAMMRSPSFSREGESSTITNSSRAAWVGGLAGEGGQGGGGAAAHRMLLWCRGLSRRLGGRACWWCRSRHWCC